MRCLTSSNCALVNLRLGHRNVAPVRYLTHYRNLDVVNPAVRTKTFNVKKYGQNFVTDAKQTPKPKSQTPEMYCIEKVKNSDYENFLSTLLIRDKVVRRCAFAFRAFNVEIAQIRDMTSNETIARMRFQFWSDVIDELFGDKDPQMNHGNQPVTSELQKVSQIANRQLSKRHLKQLIEVRSSPKHLGNFPFQTLDQLEDYCEASVRPVNLLINEVQIGQLKNESPSLAPHSLNLKLDHIATHIACAQGVCNVLRGMSYNARAGRCFVPDDLLMKCRATHEDFLRRLGDKQEVRDVCYEIASVANGHLETANGLIGDKTVKSWLNLFLPALPISSYLQKLQRHEFNVFSEQLVKRDNNLPLKLWLKSLRNKFLS